MTRSRRGECPATYPALVPFGYGIPRPERDPARLRGIRAAFLANYDTFLGDADDEDTREFALIEALSLLRNENGGRELAKTAASLASIDLRDTLRPVVWAGTPAQLFDTACAVLGWRL